MGNLEKYTSEFGHLPLPHGAKLLETMGFLSMKVYHKLFSFCLELSYVFMNIDSFVVKENEDSQAGVGLVENVAKILVR